MCERARVPVFVRVYACTLCSYVCVYVYAQMFVFERGGLPYVRMLIIDGLLSQITLTDVCSCVSMYVSVGVCIFETDMTSGMYVC